jgi:hypothetical protein
LASSVEGMQRWIVPIALVLTVTALSAVIDFVGADARWLAALGHSIFTHGSVPVGVPFAQAPSRSWPNALVLAEIAFHAMEASLGTRGLMVAQVIAVGLSLWIVVRDAVAGGASPRAAGAVTLVVGLGALPSLLIARVQLFSLVLFPLLVMLLRSEDRRPSARIWLAVPLLALWANLHGAVLVGLAVLGIYLVVVRFRAERWTAIGVAFLALAALFCTPAGIDMVSYFHGVLGNLAAKRGVGLWAPLSLTKPLDWLLLMATALLVGRLRRAGVALWELISIVLLGAVTIHASRSGIWLLLFLAPPAARGFDPSRRWAKAMPSLATVAAVAVVLAVVRGPLPNGASRTALARAISAAHGSPILAEDTQDEQIALAGARIWLGNPIDAFSKRDQGIYLDWVQGYRSGRAALQPQIKVVLTAAYSPAQRLMDRSAGFKLLYRDRTARIYERG